MLKKDEKIYFVKIAGDRLLHLSNEKSLMLSSPTTYKRLKREHNILEGLTFRVCTNKYTSKDEKKIKKMIADIKKE